LRSAVELLTMLHVTLGGVQLGAKPVEIDTVSFKLGPSQLLPPDQRAAQEMKDNINR